MNDEPLGWPTAREWRLILGWKAAFDWLVSLFFLDPHFLWIGCLDIAAAIVVSIGAVLIRDQR